LTPVINTLKIKHKLFQNEDALGSVTGKGHVG